MRPAIGLVALCSIAAGCKPDLGAPVSLITGPRILAVRGMPAEAPESATVTYDLLAVDPTGTVAAPDLGWAQCLDPAPPAESNDVSSTCLAAPDDAGPAPTFTADIPMNDCMIFGPETPPPVKGKPATRPADPDTTGGYYQPVRATWQSAGLVAFALERIRCPLLNVPGSVGSQYAANYTLNNNPTLADLILDPAGAGTALYATGQPAPPAAATVVAGQKVTLQADFTADSAETFLLWDVVQQTLVQPRESLRVSWFATGGAFDHDATGRGSDDPAPFTQNDWIAPITPGPVHFWAVLRDNRGGIDFASAEIDVTP